jgi:dephospho-CoA kinase
MLGFVLVGGWPAAGKTTLARALAAELGFAYLAKDEVKEALMDALGAPSTVEESRELGRAAVAATLRAARDAEQPFVDVDTARPVDIHALADWVRFHFESTDT